MSWREDVDLIAKTITVNQQTARGVTGTPKGRTRRTVPMTPGFTKRSSDLVVRNLNGTVTRSGRTLHCSV